MSVFQRHFILAFVIILYFSHDWLLRKWRKDLNFVNFAVFGFKGGNEFGFLGFG